MERRSGRAALVVLSVAALAVIAGCGGGGGGSYNIDHGSWEGQITRSLENTSSLYLTLDLSINGREFLDRVEIRPHSYINVEITDLDPGDYVAYEGEFENGDRVSGRFSEDGRTVFTDESSRAAGQKARSVEMNGKSEVKSGGPALRLSARAVKR